MNSKTKGVSLVEAIIATSVFSLIITAMSGVIVYSNNSSQFSGSKVRAVFLAEEMLEAARNIRDEDFANLTDGNHGLAKVSNEWSFSGSSEVVDEFTRVLNISSIDVNTKSLTSTVSWQEKGVSRDVELSTLLTYWQQEAPSGDAECLDVDYSSADLFSGNREIRRVYISNNCLQGITITHVTVEWNNSEEITRLRFHPITVWNSSNIGSPSGSQSSGTELDIVDYVLLPVVGFVENRIQFDGNMNNETFNITYRLSDGSTKVITGITP